MKKVNVTKIIIDKHTKGAMDYIDDITFNQNTQTLTEADFPAMTEALNKVLDQYRQQLKEKVEELDILFVQFTDEDGDVVVKRDDILNLLESE